MSPILNSILLVLISAAVLHAYTTADDYFHGAAQSYVLKGNAQKAKQILEEGIAAFPDDQRLVALASKIKEEQEKQQQQQNNQNQQDNDKQDKNQQNQDQNNNQDDKQKQDQDQQKQNEDKKEQDKKEQPENQQNQSPQDSAQHSPPQPSEQSEEDMKKAEARRILELYADDADSLNKPMKKAVGRQQQPEKDW